jgi:hypothetical protein
MKNNVTSDVRLSAFGPGARRRLWKTRKDIYGRIKDGRQSRICFRQRRAHNQEKNSTSKHGVQCGALDTNRHEIVKKTDSLSTIMADEHRIPTKNPKTQTIRKILDHDHEGPRTTLLWVLSYVGIPGNEKAD